jgi:hypothetical protein
MTGPRPAGRPWTITDDDMLRKLLVSGIHKPLIAQKMKRSIAAIQSRIFLFKAWFLRFDFDQFQRPSASGTRRPKNIDKLEIERVCHG